MSDIQAEADSLMLTFILGVDIINRIDTFGAMAGRSIDMTCGLVVS